MMLKSHTLGKVQQEDEAIDAEAAERQAMIHARRERREKDTVQSWAKFYTAISYSTASVE